MHKHDSGYIILYYFYLCIEKNVKHEWKIITKVLTAIKQSSAYELYVMKKTQQTTKLV